ncbi:uncharacterized protein [Montipora capricornis]|uniref:uncharacterized protein n=1 Tax=Montipora capricornis TaxID=246305 RepID=UPI0035F15EA4
MGKVTYIALASLLAISVVAASDPVFQCLSDTTFDTFQCYKEAYSFSNSHRGGVLGRALRKLVINDLKSWNKNMPNTVRGKDCVVALKNFLKPLKAVIVSEKTQGHVCPGSGKKLNETLTDLQTLLKSSVQSIRLYAHRQHIPLTGLNVSVHQVNMTSMTDLAAQQLHSQSKHSAVTLRNFVVLDFLKKAVRDIRLSRTGCFNDKLKLLTACPARDD